MIQSGHSLIAWVAIPIALALATSGCATKKYVQSQVSPVHQEVGAVKKETNEKIAYLNGKHDRDISQVNERLATTDERLTQVAEATREAQGTASRAMTEAEENSGKISETSMAITTLQSGVANALNYQLMDKADVLFGFNKATLTPQAKRTLDEIVSKAQSTPRTVIEVAGFTDPIGNEKYNLALSRRRAEAVQRYFVQQKVPIQSIHIVGLGEEAPPEYRPENVTATASKSQRYGEDRRAQVRLFGAGALNQGSASREP